MKQFCCLIMLLAVGMPWAVAQQVASVFEMKDPVVIRAQGSVKNIRKKSNDSTFVTNKFEYQDGSRWVTVPVEAKVRGNYRLNNCYYPPLKLKFNKSDVKGTIFHGNKSVKLVVPCLKSADNNTLVRKEYLCYKFYEVLSPYSFRTHLANLALTEVSQKKPRQYDLLTFFVEDNSMVAKRHQGKIMDMKRLNPEAFDEKQAVRNDYFQFMIGNSDWSSVYQHNTNILYADNKYITLSYDFDMSGFVNAHYAQASPPQLGTGDVRERVYRGFCKTPAVMEEVRQEYLQKKDSIHSIIDAQASAFRESDVKDMHSYVDEFFHILQEQYRFETGILQACRTK